MPLIIDDYGNELFHVGTPHEGSIPHSGRYVYGSGENPYRRDGSFLGTVNKYKKEYPGISNGEIAKKLGMNTREFNAKATWQNKEADMYERKRIQKMRDEDQMSFQAIAKELGYNNESSVRNIYNKDDEAYRYKPKENAELLKEAMKTSGKCIDIGEGVETAMGMSKERMSETVEILKDEGYVVYNRRIQTEPGRSTTMKVLCPPGTAYKDIYQEGNITTYQDYQKQGLIDSTSSKKALQYPASLDSKRVYVRYDEEGGSLKDGVIELRRNVPDLSLGDSRYAQVRILVDDKYYLKGMAKYSDDIPEGYDVVFNSNKSNKKTKLETMKSVEDNLKKDPSNPFGALIKPADQGGQYEYQDPKTGKMKLSPINKTREEGEWGQWSKELPSQFLSKQNEQLIKSQLDLSLKYKQAEYDEIKAYTNPVVKRKALVKFAEECDKAAVDLKAASLPRQQYQVILPLTKISDNEVYAPNYKNGEQVALVRFPHAGQFEIPLLTVNNNCRQGKSEIGMAQDAIGISAKTAERLSGADFDGDTVLVIPCNKTATGRVSKVKISNQDPLPGLVGFDPKKQYAEVKGQKHYITEKNVQREMGSVSNLITDMTLAGAPPTDMEKAVKHSMVVIDAKKHKLNYKQSEIDNDIKELKKKYQSHVVDEETGKIGYGASTIISAAKSVRYVDPQSGGSHIDKETGKLIINRKESSYQKVDKKTGEVTTGYRKLKSTAMAETDDPYTLVRDKYNKKETMYADYATSLKSMANQARLESLSVKGSLYNKEAAQTYSEEVKSINAKITTSKLNKPRERMAQYDATTRAQAIRKANDMTSEEYSKLKTVELNRARIRYGSKREKLELTDREWEAIQAGAITNTTLDAFIGAVGMDQVVAKCTPTSKNGLTPSQINRIKIMYNSGQYNSMEEIASAMGISSSTAWKYAKGE